MAAVVVATVASRDREVVDVRVGAELGVELLAATVVDEVADLRAGVVQVTEDPRAERAGLDAERQLADVDPLHAERALLDDALRALGREHEAVSGPVLLAVADDATGGVGGVTPVEDAHPVGAGGHAVPAAYAAVEVDEHGAVVAAEGRLHGADLHTRRVVAVLAGNRQIRELQVRVGAPRHVDVVARWRFSCRRLVGRCRQDPVPPVAERLVVDLFARDGARPAANTTVRVDHHDVVRDVGLLGSHDDHAPAFSTWTRTS
jgi:hypothetical protein